MGTLQYILRKAADWLFRIRPPALLLIKTGGYVLVASLGIGLVVRIAYRTSSSEGTVSVDTGNSIAILQYAGVALGGLLIVAGLSWAICDQVAEHKRSQRKRIIVLEVRGLSSSPDSTLSSSLPMTLKGKRDEIFLDLREQLQEGVITRPDLALERILHVKNDIRLRTQGLAREDIHVIVGGMAPVPFSFLLGVLLDDESATEIHDWDRADMKWRSLDSPDDGVRFSTPDIPDRLQSHTVLAVSVSYSVDVDAIAKTFPNASVVRLTLPTLSTNAHWSLGKQKALATEFFAVLRELDAKGAKAIHLVIASPASLAIRFGMSLDRRNLPPTTIYQYERTATPPYPWGIQVPTHGMETPKLMRQQRPA